MKKSLLIRTLSMSALIFVAVVGRDLVELMKRAYNAFNWYAYDGTGL